MLDFVKDVGLASSTAATRTAVIKLLGVLHRFTGPGGDGLEGLGAGDWHAPQGHCGITVFKTSEWKWHPHIGTLHPGGG